MEPYRRRSGHSPRRACRCHVFVSVVGRGVVDHVELGDGGRGGLAINDEGPSGVGQSVRVIGLGPNANVGEAVTVDVADADGPGILAAKEAIDSEAG